MTPNRSGKIISLTYHEITQDARVLKQARVLRNAGYDVNVYCDWPEGLPEHDEIDGVKITRFECYSSKNARADILDKLTFLNRSKDEIRKRYLPFAKSVEALETLIPSIEEKFGAGAIEKAQSSYFKTADGAERRRRFVEYLSLKMRIKLFEKSLPFASINPETGKKSRKVTDMRKNYRAWRKKLYQAQSIHYCSNFPEIESDDGIVAIHAHDIYCLPCGVMLSQRLKVPLIYDAHEYEPARATKMDEQAPELPEWIEDDCFPYVTRMITVSDGFGELYEKRFAGPPPTIVMNAPEVEASTLTKPVQLREDFRTVREQANVGDDVPLIVFTGGIQRTHRGVDKVLEAMVHLPEAHLVSLGPRHVTNDAWFESVAKQLGVSDRVSLLPPVDARDVPAAISTAHVSVCPFQDVSLNHRLAMPNKLFEAAFARIPICVSDLPEMRRFVETLGIGRAMDQTDPKAIAATLQEVFDNRDAYLMTPEAENRLVNHYSWQRQAEKLLALYDEVLSPASVA
ncbi:glycosyltransferase [Ruegeria conchae]|uniref:glycosyltransferase n=1 Tax=Ruegeria conchae TaxID=981384 RepID=UPI0029C93FC3|nr:glycosyltransferase [Ruegeria conchae]